MPRPGGAPAAYQVAGTPLCMSESAKRRAGARPDALPGSGGVLWGQRLNIRLTFSLWRDGVPSSEQKGIDRWQMNGMPT